MEKVWKHEQIRLLLTSDSNTVEMFLDQFAPFLYTWSYYQVGADTKIATELTGHILSLAFKEISTFDPSQETLFQWLKQQAVQSLNKALEHWQMKPQRPLSWSQLSDEVLCGLSRLCLELLDETILENPYVHEIAQAALAEIESTNRQLLINKYCHLDSVEHIAEEMNCGVEDVQNKLYRSRHSFRRVFFGLVAKANAGFSVSSDTGDIKVQDTNLEKLLSTTTLYQTLDNPQMDSIRDQLLQTLQGIEQPPSDETPQNRSLKIGVALAVIAALAIGLFLMVRHDNKNAPAPSAPKARRGLTPSPEEPTKSSSRKATQDKIDEEELKRVFAFGKAGDVEALLETLKSGQFVSQRIAAPFIGELADPSAIDLLLQAEERWYPESLGKNPFAEAIQQILIRFPDAIAPVAIEDEEVEMESKTEPNEVETAKPEPASVPNITGLVSNFSNQPIANAVIELRENPFFSKSNKIIGTAETNPLGQYQFTNIDNRAVNLTCKIPSEDPKVITRSLWSQKDSLCVLNIGGRPALTGTVTIDGTPLASQTLYLSDALNMTRASFLEEVVTDQQGSFSFLGVSPDKYFILKQDLDGRISRIEEIQMPQQDLFNATIEIDTVPVWLDNKVPSEEAGISKAILVYAPDAPDSLEQIQAIFSEDNTILFENVIPGKYVLRAQLNSGVWIQENLEIESGPDEHVVQLTAIPDETAVLSGYFLDDLGIDLFLTTADQKFHIDIEPNADGTYEMTGIPSDIYSLATWVNGQLIEFLQVDLQSELEITLDIDPEEMMGSFSPLTVFVTDALGILLSDSQVWLTGTEGQDIVTASSTGQGAFLAAPAGQYTLSVAHPKYPTKNQEIVLKAPSILAEPNSENAILVQLENQNTN